MIEFGDNEVVRRQNSTELFVVRGYKIVLYLWYDGDN